MFLDTVQGDMILLGIGDGVSRVVRDDAIADRFGGVASDAFWNRCERFFRYTCHVRRQLVMRKDMAYAMILLRENGQ